MIRFEALGTGFYYGYFIIEKSKYETSQPAGFFFFLFSRAKLVACGSYQARGRIGAVAVGQPQQHKI